MWKFAFSVVLLLAGLPGALQAQTLTECRPVGQPIGRVRVLPATLVVHRIQTDIEDAVAKTRQTFVFQNSGSVDLEGTFLLPLPKDAALKGFAMTMGKELVQGEVLEKDKAAAIYTSIVQRTRDPGLLEFVGTRLFRARIFPIPANGRVTVQVEHEEVLSAAGDLFELRHAFRSGRAGGSALEEAAIEVSLKASAKVLTLYSPSHAVTIERPSDREAKVSFKASQFRAETDFSLLFARAKDQAIGATMIAHEEKPGEGQFLLLVSPSTEASAERVQKDVVFVVDTSGSMAGKKLEQTKAALRQCLSGLATGDRFNLVRFSTEATPFAADLLPASPEEKERALAFVEALEARGGTNIHDGLLKALSQKRSGDRPLMIIFCTDGRPTIGVTAPADIQAAVRNANQALVRLFVFGVGSDLNVELLDSLAEENFGSRDYVLEHEDIEIKVSSLFSKVSDPVLTDLSLDIEGLATTAVHPKRLSDLFRGEQLLLTGRYQGSGPVKVRLRGKINGRSQAFEFNPSFAPKGTDHAYVARLWAVRRVGWLLDTVRLNGENQELKDEIVHLGKTYGIATPYTSWLVVEDGAEASTRARHNGPDDTMRRRGQSPGPPGSSSWGPQGGRAGPGSAGPVGGGGGGLRPSGGLEEAESLSRADRAKDARPDGETGAPADAGVVVRRLRGAPDPSSPQPGQEPATEPVERERAAENRRKETDERARGAGDSQGFVRGQVALSQEIKALREQRSGSEATGPDTRAVGTRTFVRRSGVWVDLKVLELPEADLEQKTQKITAFSPEWTALVEKGGEIPAILALGESVVFVLEGQVIQVAAAKAEEAPAPTAEPKAEPKAEPTPGTPPGGKKGG